MKKIIVLLTVVFAVISVNAFAQFNFSGGKINLAKGDLKFLSGEKDLLIVYNYDDMLVGDMKESDYIVKHTSEMNKKKAGSGDEWKGKWVSDRAGRYQVDFEKNFIPELAKAGITASTSKADAKYEVIIKTVVTEPGLYTGVSVAQKTTYINVDAIFVEAGKPDNILCKISCIKMVGNAGEFANYDIGLRITMAYMNCGKALGGFIVKEFKKKK